MSAIRVKVVRIKFQSISTCKKRSISTHPKRGYRPFFCRLSDTSFSANSKADILYSVSLFLRRIRVRDYNLIKERGEWRKLVMDDPEMFNDVKMAFDGKIKSR